MPQESRFRRYAGATLRSFPLYLIVLGIQVPISYLDIYSTYYDRYGLAPAFLVLLALVLLLFAVLRLILRDMQLAGLAALTCLMLLVPRAALAAPVYPVIVLCGLTALVLNVARRKELPVRERLRLPASFTHIVNVVAVMMIVAVGARAVYYVVAVARETDAVSKKAYAAVRSAMPAEPPADLPHIVHIVLDGYSRADVLKNTYGFDNSPFLNALRQRGFRISGDATTPFNQTLFVMASIFALEPITDALGPQPLTEDASTLRRVLAREQRHGVVTRILADLGYNLRSTPSAYRPLQWDRIAGTGDGLPFLQQLRQPGTYVLTYDLLNGSPILGPLVEHLLGSRFGIAAVNYRHLKDVPARRFQQPDDRPLFVYQHIIAPHPPFNIRADGGVRPLNGFPAALADGSHIIDGNDANRVHYRDGYIDKLRYINAAILEQIDRLKKTLAGPLVIILHGDHGGGLHLDQDRKAGTCVNERFSPLLAVYATDDAIEKEFTDDFNLVNIYRAIFRVLLKADLPNLPSRSIFTPWELDSITEIETGELAVPCAAPTGTRPRTLSRSPHR